MQLPFVKPGDLFDMGVLGCGPVLEVPMSREPCLGNQLVMDGNPIKCNAGYHAVLLIGGAPFPIEVGVWFVWERGCAREVDMTWKRRGSFDPWCQMRRIESGVG